VSAMLAVLKAGATYVPLDPDYPCERLAFLLRDTAAAAVLTRSDLCDRLPEGAPVVCLDATAADLANRPADNPPRRYNPDRAAHVLYTSGSTGEPKGVELRHSSVVRLVTDPVNRLVTAEDVVAQVATLTFDAATFEVWSALLNGGRLSVVPRPEVFDAD